MVAPVSGAKSVVHVAVEMGQQKKCAYALDSPRWARAGRDGHDAVEAVLEYRGR